MNARSSRRKYAFLCAALLILSVATTCPIAEVGINDDFSYIRSVKVFAETGHIAYFGWASPMLGWLLPFTAVFFKLFGFSFTAARVAMLLISASTAFFLHRVSVRLGLTEANATFTTLATILSPLYLPLSFSFMTDIPALFTLVLSLYFCLRAIQTPRRSSSIAWIATAAFAGALLGSSRQTGWLGLFLFAPATLWITRSRKLPLLPLIVWFLACTAFVFTSLRWFNRQLYAMHEALPAITGNPRHSLEVVVAFVRVLLELACLLLPILLPFALRQRHRALVFTLVPAALLTSFLVLRPHSYTASVLLAPPGVTGSYVTAHGILDVPEIGTRPVAIPAPIRYLLTFTIAAAALSFLLFLIRLRPFISAISSPALLAWRDLLLLLGLLAGAYWGFLFFRIVSDWFFDRYLLPLLVFLPIPILRLYQERIAPRLPAAAYACILLYAFFAIAGTHDLFAAQRARLAAAAQLRAVNIPPTAFFAGFGYDGWTQIDAQGYVAADNINLPPGAPSYDESRLAYHPCGYTLAHYFTAIHPRYVLSYDATTCPNPAPFPPVPYRLWLPPYHSAIYTRAIDPEQPGQ